MPNLVVLPGTFGASLNFTTPGRFFRLTEQLIEPMRFSGFFHPFKQTERLSLPLARSSETAEATTTMKSIKSTMRIRSAISSLKSSDVPLSKSRDFERTQVTFYPFI